MATAEILTIGTELLLGQIVDTNAATVARRLGQEGIDVFRCVTVGDNRPRIAAAVGDARSHADLVITTGGLGPTVDDVTREAIADALGVKLHFDGRLWSQVQDMFAAFGTTAPDNNRRQAYLPAGAVVIENPVGTAPAFRVDGGDEGAVVYCLPGVPREMNYLLEHAVLPHLRRVFAPEAVIRVRILHTAGAGESRVDERLADLETAANPSVGLAARAGLVDVRLTAKAATEAEALGLMAPVEAEVRSRLGDWVFGADGASLAGVCLQGLARRGWRLAAAECGVAGALARRLGRGAQGTAGPGGRAAPSALAAAEVLPPGAGWDAPALATATRDRWRTDVGLAVVLTSTADQRLVEVALVTPAGARSGERRLGGHPGQGPAWAANMALALLRQGVSTSPLEADNAS